jgi:mannose-1-phosphate guanylyltransferase/mannose-6-phosphate isomerase
MGLKKYKIILEPASKNTAASATLASLYINKKYTKAKILVMPSDHFIKNDKKFIDLITKSLSSVNDLSITLYGVKPDRPSTQFGYIEHESNKRLFPKKIQKFIEKPNLVNAKKLIKKQNLLWNSGIFLMKADTWLKAINKHNPNIFKCINSSMENLLIDGSFIRPSKNHFNKCPSDSIDYAVIEKLPGSEFNLDVYKLNFSWNDLGNWNSLTNLMNIDKFNNYTCADYYGYKSNNNIIYSNKNLIVTSGIKNTVIVEDDDSIFVGDRDDESALKQIDTFTKINDNNRFKNKNITYRPWGYYEDLSYGKLYKVKKIHVNPKSSLSLQSHKYRSEHWVVVDGTATVISGDDTFNLSEGESTFIKKNQKHRLMNNFNKPLIIIEVQYGKKIDESDIKRFDDRYNRT